MILSSSQTSSTVARRQTELSPCLISEADTKTQRYMFFDGVVEVNQSLLTVLRRYRSQKVNHFAHQRRESDHVVEHLSIFQLAKRFEGMLKLFGNFFGNKLCAILLITDRSAQQLKVASESVEVFREHIWLRRKLFPV